MIFFSYQFAVFTALFFLIYWVVAWPVVRRFLLLLACLVFQIYFAGPAGVLPILFLATGTFLIGCSRNPLLCTIWIGVCVFALVFYKYTHFLFQGALTFVFPQFSKYSEDQLKLLLPELPPLGIQASLFSNSFIISSKFAAEVARSDLRWASRSLRPSGHRSWPVQSSVIVNLRSRCREVCVLFRLRIL